MNVTSKLQYYDMWLAGKFGNKPQAWATLKDLKASGFRGLIVVRWRTPGRRPFIMRWTGEDYFLERFSHLCFFNVADLHARVTMHCEVMRGYRGLELRYYIGSAIYMWDAMQWSHNTWGIQANVILQRFMDHNSWEDLQILFDTYPDSVVELSTYAKNVGYVPNRNTIFWEVRNY